MKQELEDLLSIQEASKKIGMAVGTIYNRINNTKDFPIPFLKVGRLIKFKPSDIDRYLKTRIIKQAS